MSFDLQIWSVDRPRFPEQLPDESDWVGDDGSWFYSGNKWQVSVHSDAVLPEDIPAEVQSMLAGIGFLTEINLSPFDAGAKGRKWLSRTARELAKLSRGVIADPQDGTVALPGRLKRFSALEKSDAASLLTMKWCFVDGPLIQRNVTELIEVLTRFVKEALPRRYGLWEPPQYQLAVEGLEHFVRFIAENENVVWYPSPPVSDVHLFVPDEHHLKRGFRPGTFTLSIDTDALGQPGWQHAAHVLWKQISAAVRPFYGSVRISHGWRRSRGRYFIAAKDIQEAADASPEFGNLWGWWRGIPRSESRLGVVIGPPYLDLWKAFADQCHRVGGLGFVSAVDWTQTSNALETIGQAPAEISEQLRRPDGDSDYPPVWPFPRTPTQTSR
jgi:hypothetical protein